MAIKTVIEYHGHGYIYDNGDIPTCGFCGEGADTTIIHSGDYSGEHICESEGCCVEYMNQNILINPFEVTEEEIDICNDCGSKDVTWVRKDDSDVGFCDDCLDEDEGDK